MTHLVKFAKSVTVPLFSTFIFSCIAPPQKKVSLVKTSEHFKSVIWHLPLNFVSLKHHLLKQSIFLARHSCCQYLFGERRRKKKAAWRVSHTDVTSSRPFCLLCYLLSLVSSLPVPLTTAHPYLFRPHLVRSLLLWNTTVARHFLPCIPKHGPKQKLSSLR